MLMEQNVLSCDEVGSRVMEYMSDVSQPLLNEWLRYILFCVNALKKYLTFVPLAEHPFLSAAWHNVTKKCDN